MKKMILLTVIIMVACWSCKDPIVSNTNWNFFSIAVNPINDMDTAIKKGNYGAVWESVNSQTVPLGSASGTKRIYFVPVIEDIPYGQEEAYVNKFGLTLCKDAPNYLLAAIAEMPGDSLPDELEGKDIVAIQAKSSLNTSYGYENVDWFLSILPGGDGTSILAMLGRENGNKDHQWRAKYGQVFIAEKTNTTAEN